LPSSSRPNASFCSPLKVDPSGRGPVRIRLTASKPRESKQRACRSISARKFAFGVVPDPPHECDSSSWHCGRLAVMPCALLKRSDCCASSGPALPGIFPTRPDCRHDRGDEAMRASGFQPIRDAAGTDLPSRFGASRWQVRGTSAGTTQSARRHPPDARGSADLSAAIVERLDQNRPRRREPIEICACALPRHRSQGSDWVLWLDWADGLSRELRVVSIAWLPMLVHFTYFSRSR
jgi:hypothetical protein